MTSQIINVSSSKEPQVHLSEMQQFTNGLSCVLLMFDNREMKVKMILQKLLCQEFDHCVSVPPINPVCGARKVTVCVCVCVCVTHARVS